MSSFFIKIDLCAIKFSSVTESCPTLCDPMDYSTPGFPVHHQLLELTQTHVHWVGDAIQPSHPPLSPSPPAFNLSQHQGLFQWIIRYYIQYMFLNFHMGLKIAFEIHVAVCVCVCVCVITTWDLNGLPAHMQIFIILLL